MPHIPFPDASRFSHYDHIIHIEGWNESVASAHLALYRSLMFGPSPLNRVEREAIAVVVSRTNGCRY